MRLRAGESRTVKIGASEKWNDTGLELEAGAQYRLKAEGYWFDASIRAGPEGYPSPNWILRLAEPLRRVRGAPWFALIGATARDNARCFVIGRETVHDERAGGTLLAFANDVPLMYWNNSGEIDLTVERMG